MAGPLTGYKVIDLSRYIAGPYCTQLLGDMGADIIKVEDTKGDDGRRMKPAIGDLSTYFMVSNRNKRSVTLNLKHPRGKEIFTALVKDADVLVENFRPGAMERLGFAYEELRKINPRLVMASISGFGQDGPYAHRPAFDTIAQAMGGLMEQTGEPDGMPVPAGTWIADFGSGLFAAFGIMLALLNREKTGRGQHIDIALLETVASWLRTNIPDYLMFGIKHPRKGSKGDTYRSPIGAYPTRDGYIFINATTQGQFENLCQAMEHPEWAKEPRFAAETDRLANRAELNRLITEWTSASTTAAVLQLLEKGDVPHSPVADIEQVVNNPQLLHRNHFVRVKTSKGDELTLPGINVKLSETPGSIRLAPPGIGEHNAEIYGKKLGISAAELEALHRQGVI